jgi:hypothetical protein
MLGMSEQGGIEEEKDRPDEVTSIYTIAVRVIAGACNLRELQVEKHIWSPEGNRRACERVIPNSPKQIILV